MSTMKYWPQLILLSIIILTSLFTFVTPFQYSFESQYTKIISAGSPVVTFRDIFDTSPTADPIISLDKSNYQIGETATLTITDSNGDIDIGEIDSISADVTMSSLTTVSLTETGSNTGVFTTTFVIDDAPSVDYTPDSPQAARAQITLPVNPGGSVEIKDVSFSESALANLGIKPVTGAIEITLSNGATFSSLPTVTMSYANGNLTGTTGSLLQMWHRGPCPSGGVPGCPDGSLQNWELITNHDTSCGGCGTFLNSAAKTMTSDPSGGGFTGVDGQGQYVLAFDTGIPGGGGGGLVRPGLVVNALAGLSATVGGGGSGPPGPTVTLGAVALYDSAVERISMPQEIRDLVSDHDPYTPLEPIVDIYENFDLPLSINGKGFALGDYENTIETQTIQPGEQTEFVVVYYTNSKLAHSELNFNLGPTRTIKDSDTQVILDIDKPPEIVDPNDNIASFTGTINNEDDLKRITTFLVTFSETAELPNPDIVIRTWTTELSSGDTIVYDAIEIAQPEIVEVVDDAIPEPEIQTLKSQHVPIWIKNNAGWWSQELIEDSDFVAGIEYLVQNEIIKIQENQVIMSSNFSNEIPEWIKNTAGWWSEDLITEKEFIDGLQWLISNGIIQVTES